MVDCPSLSLQVNNCKEAFSLMGALASTTSPLTTAANTFLASPSEMDNAISIEVVFTSTFRTEPSGRVMSIIKNFVQR